MHCRGVAVALAWGLFWRGALADVAFSDRFEVDYNPRNEGNCAWIGEERLSEILHEARIMAADGERLMDKFKEAQQDIENGRPIGQGESSLAGGDASGLIESVRLADYYFFESYTTKVHSTIPDETIVIMRRYFTLVAEWIDNGGPTNRGRKDHKPVFKCSDTFRVRQSENDVLMGSDGKPDPGGKLIKNDDEVMKKIQSKQDSLKNAKVKQPDGQDAVAVPYWIPERKVYVADESYSGSEYNACSADYKLSGRTYWTYPEFDLLLMCPYVFKTSNERPNMDQATILGEIPAKPTRFMDIKPPLSNYQTIEALRCPSHVLFHELLHIVLGQSATVPKTGEIYSIAQLLASNRDLKLPNAETYALAALAWHYTLNTPVPQGSFLVEFWSAYTTRG